MSTQVNQAVQSKQVELVSRPEGMPTSDNFRLNQVSIAPIEEGEILVRNEWMSVDPYMRGRMKEGDSYVPPFRIDEPLEGGCVGRVVESKNDRFAEGDLVLGNQGWREYWKSDGEGVQKIDPELGSPQAFLGVLGMTGMTAWVGLKRIANLRSGDTVFVSAASGAVGSIVAQIAKANQCTVIGSAGKESKIEWLRDKAGIESVINYKKTKNLSDELARLAPNGIDVYFDNVGGDHLEAALEQMNDFGRIAACGMISTYNATEAPSAPRNLFRVIAKRIRMQGFIVRDHMDDYEEFISDVSSLIRSDQIVWEETVTEGLENAPKAFIGLFEGDNLGKSLVRIS
ncbi:NADP-dependent oxidoreductase [Rhodopirellula sallentina]|uniref:Alcohol dehydrogenase zinc-binding domain-containing protein n=1 Tax=Rhodopirellula sallentina SM41 TaxID=1263870 RepID=M5U2U3_9BACT|nr:NADP-dependent oxidoreductase [Rhodopirellula sallentina]EMI52176.1 alcohol dehydrogenase zinc-binding domain-containing protein [Rhodopirellula sallentina SM41]